MKTFMFKAYPRTGGSIGLISGIVQAESREAASDKAFAEYDPDASYSFEMWDITPKDGEPIMSAFAVYKNEI